MFALKSLVARHLCMIHDLPCLQVIANKMIELDSGEWMLPFWREKPDRWGSAILSGAPGDRATTYGLHYLANTMSLPIVMHMCA